MKELLSDCIWDRIALLARDHARLRAAIAYVTATHIEFREGDVLICDASENAIKSGQTSARTLRHFWDAKADLYSLPGLHSKVAVIDDKAIVGSANLSESAGVRTCEAALLTSDPEVVALVLGFVEQLRLTAEPITKRFLQTIEKLPVTQQQPPAHQAPKPIRVSTSRLWLMATHPLSDRIIEAERQYSDAGDAEARTKITRRGYEIDSVRWTGSGRFREKAKVGDLVIQLYSPRRGSKGAVEVYEPAPIIHRQDEAGWTRFYFEVPKVQTYWSWEEFERLLKRLDISNVTQNSVREIVSCKSALLELMSSSVEDGEET